MDRALLVTNCVCHVSGKPSIFRVVGKNFLASSEFFQQLAAHTRGKANSGL